MLNCLVYVSVIVCATVSASSKGLENESFENCDVFVKGSESYYQCLLRNYQGQEVTSEDEHRSFAKVLADFIRFILRMTRPYSDTVLDSLYSVWIGKTRELPPIDNEILLLSATELAEKIRKRQISSEEVVSTYVERSKSIHSMINAVVDDRYEDAIQDARKVDRFLALGEKTEEQIADDTPLLGLPFTCKEAIGVKGLSNTWGLVRGRDHKAAFDADTTALYRMAGGIPVTVTNVPELLYWWESANQVYGMTRNPYDNRRTVGGSSGGEAAIITSAGALFGIGNDFAGSIRIPASFNGIYGHKPSRGVISNHKDTPFLGGRPPDDRTDEFLSTGPMCRYAGDLHLLVKVLSDNDERIKLNEPVDIKKLTIYYMEELPGYLMAAVPEVKNAINTAVKHFEEEHGVKAIKLTMDELYYAHAIWESKILEYGNQPFVSLLSGGEPINLYEELNKNIQGVSNHTLYLIYLGLVDRRNKDAFYYKCLRKYKDLERKINDTLQDKNAILLVPTHPEPPPHYLMTIPKYPNIGYTNIFNILGFPSTNIPAGLSDKGLPFGIQAVSGRFQDRLSLAVALELDKVFKGWQSPCLIKV